MLEKLFLMILSWIKVIKFKVVWIKITGKDVPSQSSSNQHSVILTEKKINGRKNETNWSEKALEIHGDLHELAFQVSGMR